MDREEMFKALGEVKEQFNDLSRRIDNYFTDRHAESISNSETNGGGIDELGEMASTQVGSIDELATLVSDLTERVAALESKNTENK